MVTHQLVVVCNPNMMLTMVTIDSAHTEEGSGMAYTVVRDTQLLDLKPIYHGIIYLGNPSQVTKVMAGANLIPLPTTGEKL